MDRQLTAPVTASSRRSSSWDRTGANRDWIEIDPGETAVLMEHRGPGCITHLYAAMMYPEIADYRDAILRCYWDGADEPSVEVPMGDFFTIVQGRIREIKSAMVTVNPGFGVSHGLSAYFRMPFSEGARITLENRGPNRLGGRIGNLWFHVDYDVLDHASDDEPLRFHAQYRQERPTSPVGAEPGRQLHDAANLDGAENYVALDTVGQGRMVGLVLEVDNHSGGWWGEGDDMVFVDGSSWPPAIHGTGTEEIFAGGASPAWEYAGPYTGTHLIESPDYAGLTGMYRWYLHDPISFRESLRWTIEHGHANNYANDYSSVAYWYQAPITSVAGTLPLRDDMLPRLDGSYAEARALVEDTAAKARELGVADYGTAARSMDAFFRGAWDQAISDIRAARMTLGIEG
ncbi:MAG TPA: glycoside hydrolase family 172 protein [Acidimicrobiia bacterium]|nr:glycoside hydrolase family 172 protein [Acidimicrobiia bacterium]